MTVDVKDDTLKYYHEQINKVLEYINCHLAEKLDLNELASQGNYSTFHFHRIMRAYLGESLGVYVSRIRLETASHLLRLSDVSVNEVAFKVGYENPSSFNKAFKKRFETSPLDYRKNKSYGVANYGVTLINRTMETILKQPKIKDLKPKKVIYVQAMGAYNESAGVAWDKVCSFAQKNRLFGFKTEMIGISHDDPTVTEASKIRYDACVCISKDISPEGEVGVKEIAGGKYAIFMHKGPYENFNDSYGYIYGKWIPDNDITLRDEPCLEKYLNAPGKTKPEKLKTEIFIPIE